MLILYILIKKSILMGINLDFDPAITLSLLLQVWTGSYYNNLEHFKIYYNQPLSFSFLISIFPP